MSWRFGASNQPKQSAALSRRKTTPEKGKDGGSSSSQRRSPRSSSCPPPGGSVVLSEGERRTCIKGIYMSCGKPAPADWKGADGLVSHIIKTLGENVISQEGSRRTVEGVLRRLAVAEAAGLDCDVSCRKVGSGLGNKKLNAADWAHDDAIAILASALNLGLSMGIAVGRCNAKLLRDGRPPITKTVALRIVGELGGRVSAVGTAPQGSRDASSPWGVARNAFLTQVKAQFAAGALLPSQVGRKRKPNKKTKEKMDALTEHMPLVLERIAWFDQVHAKVEIGAGAMMNLQWSIPIAKNGRPCPISEGGVMPPKKFKRKLKFPAEVRVQAGLAAVIDKVTGKRKAVRSPMWDYGGPSGDGWLLGPAQYDLYFNAEIARVVPLKGVWAKFNSQNPYKERFPLTWKEEIKKCSHMKKWHDVRDMMFWTKEAADKMFKGSTYEGNYVLWVDGLKQWWEKEAQAYLETLGLRHRQVRCLGDTAKGSIYNLLGNGNGTVPGDSPSTSICDDNCFGEHKRSRGEHVTATFDLPQGDPKKFSMATPSLALKTFQRVWQVAPSDERIFQCVDGIPTKIQDILDVKGGVVEKVRRRGKRAKNATQRAMHPDAMMAMAASEAKWGGTY